VSSVESLGDLASGWRDGRIKQAVIQRILGVRRKHPELFACGSYEPIEAGSEIISFVRRDARAVVAVAAKLYPWRALAWDAPVLKVSADVPLRDILTGRPTDSLRPSELFCQLPVSILVSEMVG
jgi:maltooligosyltrehalose synthase